VWWCGEFGLTFNLTHGDESLGKIVVEFFDKIFGDQLGPLTRVLLVVEKWHENLFENAVHVFQGLFGDFHDNKNISHHVFCDLILHVLIVDTNFAHKFQNDNGLSLFNPISRLLIFGVLGNTRVG